jgi:hypothetical protein
MEQNYPADAPGAPAKKREINLCRILAVIGLIIIIGWTAAFSLNDLSYIPIKASVLYGSDKIYVTNEGDFAWENVQMVLNAEYKFNIGMIQPGEQLVVEHAKFIKHDGIVYDPVNGVSNMRITIETADDHHGVWYCQYSK